MASAIETVLRQYDQRAADEMKQKAGAAAGLFAKRIDEFLLTVGPATGQLMNLLIKEAKARIILELGTSHGFDGMARLSGARRQGHHAGDPHRQTAISPPGAE